MSSEQGNPLWQGGTRPPEGEKLLHSTEEVEVSRSATVTATNTFFGMLEAAAPSISTPPSVGDEPGNGDPPLSSQESAG